MATKDNADRDTNPDLITGAPGSHPVATGVGAIAAGAAGAAIGSVVPGIGTVIGGVIGAVVGGAGGGAAGHAVGEVIDPTGTDAHWANRHATRTDSLASRSYDEVKPAYQYGASMADRPGMAAFDEKIARKDWEAHPAAKGLKFDDAKSAIKDEFNRKVQLREEQLNVSKNRVSAGEVGIRKEVTTATKTVEVPVEREELVITRHAVAGGSAATGAIGEDETIRVPLTEEQVNVSKNTVVTGEVEIGKRKVTDTKTVSDSLRKEELKVDNQGNVKIDDRTK